MPTSAARSAIWRGACAATFSLLLASPAPGQGVSGTVSSAGIPVPGAVLTLVTATDSVVARALSDARGHYRINGITPGAYRVRAIRIGFRPTTSDTIAIANVATVTIDVALVGLPIDLPAVRVSGSRACGRVTGESARETSEVWEQARAALSAALLTGSTRPLLLRRVAVQRMLDPGGRKVLAERTSVLEGELAEPWVVTPLDSLRRRGYVLDRADSTVYRAPGLDMLVSDAFIADHCLRLVRADGDSLGIAFDPVPARRRIPEVRGTAWLDGRTAALRSIEYRFVNVSREIEDAHAGGRAEFTQIPDGGWAIARWELRMPVIVLGPAPGAARVAARMGMVPQVAAINTAGGSLALVRTATEPGDTLWAGPAVSLSGTIADSSSGEPVPEAQLSLRGAGSASLSDQEGRFALPAVVPGTYTLDVRTPSLDSVNAVNALAVTIANAGDPIQVRVPNATQLATALCGREMAASGPSGIVFGTVTSAADSVGVPGASLTAEWIDAASGDLRWKEASSGPGGWFRFCGVPLGRTVVLRANSSGGRSEPVVSALLGDHRFANAGLVVDPALPPAAMLVGTVVRDSTATPIEDAEISITELGKSMRSDARGGFRLQDIPPGEHEVVVRRVGYGAMVAKLAFAAGAIEQRRIVLTPMTVLNDVIVTAAMPDPLMRSFEEHRKLGLGRFVTREDLAKFPGVPLGGILAMVPGVDPRTAFATGAWIGPVHPRSGRCPSVELQGVNLLNMAIKLCCYSAVYLDHLRLYDGSNGQVPNVSRFHADEIEAVEYYDGPAQTPAEYSDLNSTCGVLVLHTRRSFEKP